MGINNLFKFLRDKYPKLLHEKYLFQVCFGSKIVVDISSYIYKYKAIYREKWLNAFIKFLLFFKKYNLHVSFVFDGKPPALKALEQKRRFIQKEKLEDKAQNLYLDLEEYKNTGKTTELLFDVMKKIIKNKEKKGSKKDKEKIRRLLHKSDETNEDTKEVKLNVEMLEGRLTEIEGQIINITSDDIESLKQILTYLGISYLQSNTEAETLATYLCNQNKAKIVISEDSDVLTYLNETGISVSKFDPRTGTCIVIYMKELLKALKMTKDQFIDFCILSGTDYNENIRLVGSVKSFGHITKYKSIENFIKKVNSDVKKPLQFERIKDYKEIRDIFKHTQIPMGRFYTSDQVDNKFHNNKEEMFHLIESIPIWDEKIDLDKCFEYLKSLNIFLEKEIKDAWEISEQIEIKIEFVD